MQGDSYELCEGSLERNQYAVGRKRVKSWLLGTAAMETKNLPFPKGLCSGSRCFEEANGIDGCNEGMSDTSFEPFSPTNKGDRIVINVGGTRHETFIGTLHSLPDTRLYWITEKNTMSPEYDPDRQEYFFDRHPGLFSYILDYYRTGKLHCPSDVCGPLFEEELVYWGIDEALIEPCCWMNYHKHRDAEVNLQSFDSIDGDDERNSSQASDVENQVQVGEQDAAVGERRSTINSIVRKWTYWQPKVWSTLEEPNSSKAAQIIGLISMSLIIISVTTFCLETLEFFENRTSLQFQFLYYLEIICVVWFTLEFLSRFLFCGDKVAFFKSAMNWIDFCAIFPFYLELMLRRNNMKTIVVLRVVRITRLFRIFKLSRHSYGLQILGHTLKSSCRELFLLVFFLSIAVIIFSSLIYYAEKDLQAEKFDSIPGSFWWSVVTMTTIGYGDIVPKTAPGKCVGILCALCGVLVIALPIPVIVNNFSLYYSHAQARLRVSNKRKRPLLFGAANALRMTDPWMPNRLLQKQRSDQSDFAAILHSPRRTPLASPTHTLRQFGAINSAASKCKESGARGGQSRNSPCPSINSSLNSRTSGKSPPSRRKISNVIGGYENQTSRHCSPIRTALSQLPVIRLSPNYESPSINVSPPSTPSKTNSQIQSSIGSPYPLSPYAESSMYSQELYSSTCASRQELSPLHSPLFLNSPGKSTLSTGISDFTTTPSTPRSFSSCSSKLASPRGRMGRRNGICILAAHSRGQTRRKIQGISRTKKQLNHSVADSSDSQVSSRRDSKGFNNIESRGERNSLVAPSPGVSKTLFEVSRRLEVMLPEDALQEVSPKKEEMGTLNEAVRSAYSSRPSSPLVRQKATNVSLNSMSSQEAEHGANRHENAYDNADESVPKLESVINGMIFKRRSEQKRKTSQASSRNGDLSEGSNASVGSRNVVETSEFNEKEKLSSDLATFGSIEVKDSAPSSTVLQPENDGKRFKTKSLTDIRTDVEREKNFGIRNFFSVVTSPSSMTRFQFTVASATDKANVEKEPLDGDSTSNRQMNNRSLVCFENRRCKSAENNSKGRRIVNESIAKSGETVYAGRLTQEFMENISIKDRNSIDLPMLPDDSPKVNLRNHGIISRNNWASSLGKARDSGVHSMSMSQNQETFTLDVPLGELSEGIICHNEGPICKLQSTVH